MGEEITKEIQISLNEKEAETLWWFLTKEIISTIEENDREWILKYPIYDLCKSIRAKIDSEKRLNQNN